MIRFRWCCRFDGATVRVCGRRLPNAGLGGRDGVARRECPYCHLDHHWVEFVIDLNELDELDTRPMVEQTAS